MLQSIFKNKTVNFEKLLSFGFTRDEDIYTYSTNIVDGQFKLIVNITSDGEIKTRVMDIDSGSDYILHLVADAVGSFVGKVRTDYKNILEDIAEKCFDTNVFKSEYAHKIIEYVAEKYQDSPEFLWKKFSNNAIFRRKDNQKWYAALLIISKKKLGIDSDEIIDIIDLRIDPAQIDETVDGQKYFPGFHMNKRHWLTICLDGSVPIDEICNRIDASYILAKK